MKALRSISAVVLAFLVLMSSTSFMVGMHFCRGEVKSLSLFSAAEQCNHQEKPRPSCHRHLSDCCQDKVVTHDGDDFKNTLEKLQISGHVGLEVLQTAFVIAQVIPSISLDDSPATTYDPPANFADITVSLQVFRI